MSPMVFRSLLISSRLSFGSNAIDDATKVTVSSAQEGMTIASLLNCLRFCGRVDDGLLRSECVAG